MRKIGAAIALAATMLACSLVHAQHAPLSRPWTTAAKPAVSPIAMPIPPCGKIYTVVSGDSYWKISERRLGSPIPYLRIAEINHRDPNKPIHPGDKIFLPCAEYFNLPSRTVLHAQRASQAPSAQPDARKFSSLYPRPPSVSLFARADRPYSTMLDNNPTDVSFGANTAHWVKEGFAMVKVYKGVPYLAFRDWDHGIQAAIELISGNRYAPLTVDEALQRWSGNDYDAKILKGRIDDRKKVKELTRNERKLLLEIIAQRETGKYIQFPSL